ncbi:hypothetical protein P5V47_08785 [Mycobacteroides abscessus subsp. massiliense]|uniref:hypothetical protein n=1 Tax=Mycobacteroides abscessus TaxID=36809 RepID=UPI00266BC55F|nr:hypothetical protein [Mycobacteroides abscessus]MDO3298787.1 hypothetical protein [Mycobacteroides abscessus subsp. massiliense]
MTYGYEIDGLADTAVKLGVTIGRPVPEIVNEYAQGGLPIEAAHVVQTDRRTYRIYWVSGTSLVALDTQDPEQGALGFSVQATAAVYQLQSARVALEALAFQPDAPAQEWNVARTVRLDFDGETVVLPNPLSLPLDNEAKRTQVNSLLNVNRCWHLPNP